ncbi:DUF2986 domain-containing protein [Aliamphritea spongicola]
MSNKPRYISKAERAKLAENQPDSQTDTPADIQPEHIEAS